jgi:hypothetical protein
MSRVRRASTGLLIYLSLATATIGICNQLAVAQSPADRSDWSRLAQAGGTNTQAGSMTRGVHVYCPGNSPFKYCKPPVQKSR